MASSQAVSCVGRVPGAIALGPSLPGVANSTFGTRTALCFLRKQLQPSEWAGRSHVHHLSELEEDREDDDPQDSRPGRVHRRVPARCHWRSSLWEPAHRGAASLPGTSAQRGTWRCGYVTRAVLTVAVGTSPTSFQWGRLLLTLNASRLSVLKATEQT